MIELWRYRYPGCAWEYSEIRLPVSNPEFVEERYILYTDHQAAMREASHAAMELATAIRGGIPVDAGGTVFTKRGMDYVETKIADLLSVLSAHQECGGGGE